MIEIGGGVAGLIWLIVLIWAVIQTLQSATGGLGKLLWILILVCFPLVGLIFWFLLGPGRR